MFVSPSRHIEFALSVCPFAVILSFFIILQTICHRYFDRMIILLGQKISIVFFGLVVEGEGQRGQ